MARWIQVSTHRTLVLAGGAFVVCATALAAVWVVRGPVTAQPSVWVVPLTVGALLALVALLLVERSSGPADEGVPAATSCAACGKPIIEEWRLCPHCGELLECELTLPVEGGPTRG